MATITLTPAEIAAAAHARAERQRAERARAAALAKATRGLPLSQLLLLGTTIALMLAAIAGVWAMVPGCQTPNPAVIADPRPPLIAAGPLVKEKAQDVGHQADTIDDLAERYSALLTPAQSLVWRPYKAGINAATSAQRQDVGALLTVPPVIDTAVRQTTALVDQNATLRQQNADLKEKLAARGQLWLTLLIVGGCIGIAVGITDAIEGNVPAGIAICTFSAALAVVATIFRDHSTLVIVSAVVLVVGGAAYAIVKRAKAGAVAADAKAALADVKAVASAAATEAEAALEKMDQIGTELVHSGEILKENLTADVRKVVSGVGATKNSLLDNAQSPATQAYVATKRQSGAVRLAKPLPVTVAASVG